MLKLIAEQREVFGKQLKSARRAGKLPVVMYGRKTKPAPLFVQTRAFKKIFEQAGESSVITLQTPEGEVTVLVHDLAFHPVTSEPIHADFYVVEKDTRLKIKVPIEFTGVSAAVKELGGILIKVLHELEVEALPADLPRGIAVDLAPLTTLESQILVADLVLPRGVKVVNRPDEVVAAVTVAKEEPAAEAAPLDLSAIEVEKRGKEEVPAAEPASPAEQTSL
ncbi:MAG: 50S ribosomal protein L25 [Candidatus Vogelbacteria bacterium]|nr:50S ribosomal protein L25 [Candidatus Vogelbacteria bacterium]